MAKSKARKRSKPVDTTSAGYRRGFEDGLALEQLKSSGAKGRVTIGLRREGPGPGYAPGLVAGRRAGRLRCDHAACTVTWQGQTKQIGHVGAFYLLADLVKHRDKVVPFDRLKEAIGSSGCTDATMRGKMRDLKMRLCRVGFPDLAERIKAVRGRGGGYRLSLSS